MLSVIFSVISNQPQNNNKIKKKKKREDPLLCRSNVHRGFYYASSVNNYKILSAKVGIATIFKQHFPVMQSCSIKARVTQQDINASEQHYHHHLT